MKAAGEKDDYMNNDSCCRGLFWTFCALSVMAAFGVVNYLQFREIWVLKDRVDALENKAYIFAEVPPLEIQPNGRSRRAVATDSLTGLITALVDNEVKVLESYCGNSSKICLPGAKGDAGQKGDVGAIGIRGNSGPGGPPGVKGHQGQYGVPGPPGLKGDSGLNGPTGAKGDMGAKGEKGDLGLRGIPGVKGAQGQYGAPGVPGFKGDPGSAGLPGQMGQKGDEGRPLPLSQQCCSSLSRPAIDGSTTEVIRTHVGQSVILPCSTHGFPPPVAVFTPSVDPTGRNRFSMSPAGMEIQGVALSDSGQYKCVVDNALGHSEKTIQLVILDRVVATTVPTSVNVNEGDAFNIDCDVSGNPPPVVIWHHVRSDGTDVAVTPATATIPGRSTVRIRVAHAADAGRYTCTAQNQYEKDEAVTFVSITSRPQILQPPQSQTVMIGSTVALDCGVIGTPPLTVSWTFPLTGSNPPLNARLSPDNSVQLASVDQFNSGTYTCTATNAQGTTTANATIIVEQGVTVTAFPHLMPATSASPVVNLQCSANGSPVPTITWTKGGMSLAGKYLALSGGNLIITMFDVTTDTGLYECTGSNANGNATDRAMVYNDQGQLNCTASFGDTRCTGSEICGGRCPSNCLYTTNDLYGYQTYPAISPICIAARHTGTLPTPDGVVIWQHETQQTTYVPFDKNGLQSQAHAPTSDASTILTPPGNSGPIIAPPVTVG